MSLGISTDSLVKGASTTTGREWGGRVSDGDAAAAGFEVLKSVLPFDGTSCD